MKKLPYSYKDRNGTYYLRYVFTVCQSELLSFLPRDIRLSLRTKKPSIARCRLRRLLYEIDLLISDLLMTDDTNQELQFLAKLKELQRKRDDDAENFPIKAAIESRRKVDKLQQLQQTQVRLQNELEEESIRLNRLVSVKDKKIRALQILAESKGRELTEEELQLIDQSSEAVITSSEARRNHSLDSLTSITQEYKAVSESISEHVLEATYKAQSQLGRLPDKEVEVSELLSSLLQSYQNARSPYVKKKTLKEKTSSFKLFIEIVGDLPGKELGTDHLDHFAAILPKVPPNVTKTMESTGKSFGEIMQLDLSPRTITTTNNVFADVRTILRWLRQRGKVAVDPAILENLEVKRRQDESERRAWELNELQILFDGYVWRYDADSVGKARSNETVCEHSFWVPLVGLFSGARLEEICSLKASEVVCIDETWCFDMPYYDQTTGEVIKKNRSSGRVIPVHSELKRIGLIEYARCRQETGAELLFDGVVIQEGKYSQAFSKWFNRTLKKKLGLPVGDNSAVFHSFRSNVIDVFEANSDLTEAQYSRVTGHTTGGIARNVYAFKGKKIYPPSQLVNVVDAIEYPELDLSHVSFKAFRKKFETKPRAKARKRKRSGQPKGDLLSS